MVYTLEGAGHKVHWVDDPAKGLVFVETHAPRIIFSDIEMPGMNGLEFAARLHLSGHKMPLWLMSASRGRFASQVDSALASGHARGFLDKPIDVSALKDLAR
ncbi:MAG: response regulator [Candidatus Magasanikbacteria bacterium]|nr:response regulator [Candidatus Magasanikbacteria bacterium]